LGRLSGKVCIITGTGGSIGHAAALAFAREEALVVGCDLNVDAAQATVDAVHAVGGTMVSLQPCRLSQPTVCQALVDFSVRTFGRIDVLFNNAAMAYFNWLEDISDEEWDRNRREEVDLVFYLTRAAWPFLKTSHGVVVNTASLTALMSFKNLGSLAHTTAQAGIIGMTRQLAMEGRAHGDSRQFDFSGSNRNQPNARAVEGSRMGRLHARQDAAWPSRSARGSGARSPVSCL
jgi:NAD(P)-dependent dehydrogenase (short-subunit alcohol dehydrogenase family)